jgi:hypothetical protein
MTPTMNHTWIFQILHLAPNIHPPSLKKKEHNMYLYYNLPFPRLKIALCYQYGNIAFFKCNDSLPTMLKTKWRLKVVVHTLKHLY